MNSIIVTIDGPAASGKGTLSKKISLDFNLYYLETGIYYRALASLFNNKKNLNSELSDFIVNLNKTEFIEFVTNNDQDLYTVKITKLASKFAKILDIRKFIVNIQQETINSIGEKFNGIILEGRDCGTVIAPKADVKIFLTSNIETRAQRRFDQFVKDGKNISYKKVLYDLQERDMQDQNREHSPLQKPKDAIILDNTNYNLEETINIVKNIIFSNIPSLKNKI